MVTGMDKFDYDKAEADLYDSGCLDSEAIYGYRSERGRNEFMRENGLSPDKYYSKGNSEDSISTNGGCFISTACVEARGLLDDCHELTVLRDYRDNYLKNRQNGPHDIAEYYRYAPKIVASINQRDDAIDLWGNLFDEVITPCVSYIEEQRYEEAYLLYKSTIVDLKKKFLS